ncbi:MAG TPA: SirB2 family protein [Plasticicumulans sp.]|nr:SirB2 family protein [Plasticicumulans sp.]
MYLALHHTHVTAVCLSLGLFTLRGLWMLAGSPRVHAPWTRWLPPLIDTVLLASAIDLTRVLGQYPFVNGWLSAKVLALVVYIGLGAVALRHGRTYRQRATAFAAALLTAGYIVGAALQHSPASWLARL